VLRKIALDNFPAFVSALMERGTLYAPVETDYGVDFGKISDPATVKLDFYNTTLSPNLHFFALHGEHDSLSYQQRCD